MNLIKLLLILPLLMVTCSLAGCGGSDEATVVPASPVLDVEDSYESDSYGDTTDESAN